MSLLLFLVIAVALFVAYRYINAHENLVRQVEALVTVGGAGAGKVPEPFDLKESLVAGLETIKKLVPK